METAPAQTLYQHDIADTLPAVPEPAFRRSSLDPTKIFVDKDRTALLWFFVAMASVGIAVAEPFFLVPVLKARERVVVIDPSNTYFVCPHPGVRRGLGPAHRPGAAGDGGVFRTQSRELRQQGIAPAPLRQDGTPGRLPAADQGGGRIPRQADPPEA